MGIPATLWLLAGLLAVPLYAYVGYPLLLRLVVLLRGRRDAHDPARPGENLPGDDGPTEWPSISVTVPVFNEEHQIRGLLDNLLALDYPADRRHILIVSDASTDRTDAIVAGYADRGVELLRLPKRGGKGTAEIAAGPHLRGEIVVNTDASIRFHPASLKPLIARFADPAVGVASGRDVSVSDTPDATNAGESGYVGYEMWVRGLETAAGGIVGASGCFYAIRTPLHREPLSVELSRDFAACLIAHEHGYRSVSVDAAICYVPRTPSLHREYRRKVRTMALGLQTLLHKRHLMNPLAHGRFAWMLVSHKLMRWLVPPALVLAAGVLVGLALAGSPPAGMAVLGLAATAGVAAVGWRLAAVRPLPRLLSLPTFAAASTVAALHAWLRVVRGDLDPVWEPTRRAAAMEGTAGAARTGG
jgi:cellulose synthase/poly-beta-1,6-N-acetylglucosamine synthase-like glycosyltransferase